MRVEGIPIIFGALVILIGGTVAADAWGNPERGPMRERRRRIRASIDHRGEQLVGIGTLLLGVALVGRDAWRFGTLTVLLGTVLIVWGGVRNRDYIKEIVLFRGAARRGFTEPTEKSKRVRIR